MTSLKLNLLLLGMLGVVVLPSVSEASCLRNDIARCQAYISPYVSVASIKHYTRTGLQHLCRAATTWEECLRDLMSSCNKATNLELQQKIEQARWLCNEGFEDHIASSSTCYKKPEVQSVEGYCRSQYEPQMRDARNAVKKCSVKRDWLKCTYDQISSRCTTRDGYRYYKFLLIGDDRTYKDTGCDLGRQTGISDPDAKKNSGVQITSTGILLLLVMTAFLI